MIGAAPPGRSAWRTLGVALLWILLGNLAAFLVTFAISFVVSFLRAALGARMAWLAPLGRIEVLGRFGVLALELTLLWGAMRLARTEGGGDQRAGLAFQAVPRIGTVLRLAGLQLVWVAVLVGSLTWLMQTYPMAKQTFSAFSLPFDQRARLFYVVNIVFVAPIAEELFFRGWLWTALRRRWGHGATLWATTCFWAALHLQAGWLALRPLLLIPTGLILGTARARTGSVRACLLIHFINNALVVGIQLYALRG